MTSETVNNVRRIYTDGRGHTPEEDAYPLWYGDSIGFWDDHKLVVHTSQMRANIFHRNDPAFSDKIETVEIWRKLDQDTLVGGRVGLRPGDARRALVRPRHVYARAESRQGIAIRYWDCHENPNNDVVQTENGGSEFKDFTFTDKDDSPSTGAAKENSPSTGAAKDDSPSTGAAKDDSPSTGAAKDDSPSSGR